MQMARSDPGRLRILHPRLHSISSVDMWRRPAHLATRRTRRHSIRIFVFIAPTFRRATAHAMGTTDRRHDK